MGLVALLVGWAAGSSYVWPRPGGAGPDVCGRQRWLFFGLLLVLYREA
jgi:hypothetical protein